MLTHSTFQFLRHGNLRSSSYLKTSYLKLVPEPGSKTRQLSTRALFLSAMLKVMLCLAQFITLLLNHIDNILKGYKI